MPQQVSDYLRTLHERHGVAIHIGAMVRDILPVKDGLIVDCGDVRHSVDRVVVGIGIDPATEIAEAAGLLIENGIVVDDCGRTSDPAISAAGDVTNQPCGFSGNRVRLESWINAQNQAIIAAKAVLGHDVRHVMVPWVWSDQYDANIQIIGTPEHGVEILLRGDPTAGSGCWLAIDRGGTAIGAVAVNAPKELRVVRKALETKATPDRIDWGDPAVPANRIRVHAAETPAINC